MITEFLTRLRFLVFRKKRSEFDEELRFHLEQSIAMKVAGGLNAGEARRQALIDFGGVERAREQCEEQRPGWWAGLLSQDLRCALRGIFAHRWFSGAIILTLALGIGLNTMVFTLVNAVLFKPVPQPNGNRLVSVMERNLKGDDRSLPLSYPDFVDYRTQATSYEFFEATTDQDAVMSERGNPPQQFHLDRCTAGIFSMVEAKAILGRGLQESDEQAGAPPVVVIGYNVWKERYAGVAGIVGRQVQVDGQPATIVGVMPKDFRFPHGVDLWMPLIPNADLFKRENRLLRGYAILKPHVAVKNAQTELSGISARLARQYPVNKDLGISVLTFNDRFNGGQIRIVFLLMLAGVGFVLLIACADVANMMLSRSLNRQREMSIRSALGASRWRIVRQLLLESVLLSALGGLMGLGLAQGGIRWFDLATAPIRPDWIHFTMNFPVFGYFAALCIFSGLLFGIAPALRSSKPNPIDVLKDGAHSVGRRRGGWLSSVLVMFQFAVTLVLLTGAGMFVRSLLVRLAVNPSIPADRITTARLHLPEDRYKDNDARIHFFDQLLPRLRSIPGASHAAIASAAPAMGTADQQIELEHQPIANPAQRPRISFVAQSPGYFETIHVPLQQGRDFTDTDGTPHHEAAIVTRDAAMRLWPGENPMGKRFRLFDEKNQPSAWITIVGVSADMVQELQTNDPRPLLFVPYRQEGWDNMALVVDAATDPLPSMRQAVQSLDGELPLSEPFRLNDALDQLVWFLRVFGRVFAGFALIGMLMASVGIYAVIAHATENRTQEIGVRIALGANLRNILALVMARGLWQISVGLVVGLAAALPLAHFLGSAPLLASRFSATDFLAIASMLALVGVFACWLPARRATTLDPVRAIRYE
ncbi:ABC transporter permease [Acidobacteria bacterium AB60]|nr:ABC transporter permease [Acidobacteria bacterium AB60]